MGSQRVKHDWAIVTSTFSSLLFLQTFSDPSNIQPKFLCDTILRFPERISSSLSFDPRQRLNASKLLQSCPTLCDPTDGSPPGSPVPGILQARTLEWVAISFSNAWKWKVKVKSLSRVRLFTTPWTAIHRAIISSISMVITGISRDNSQHQIPLTRKRIPQREIVATLKTLQLVLWDPVESECFSRGLWDFL